ncbi:heat shock protein Hsp15 [Sulfuritortus calidifontis]|uniref:Heat shock protein Hsp15 n=1 Tax=Sulfuritortus calidifontis TaxID=1914471 RepID=A0A4R3JXF0_9PROT|nr:heat shock protein Hsp15 [Sulfuritortus calidifontis]
MRFAACVKIAAIAPTGFYETGSKTRRLAAQAVEGGKVKLNGERTKPGKELKPGDRLLIHIGAYAWDITVTGLSDKRGPAAVAKTLYTEDEASHARRQQQVAERKATADPGLAIKGRPTKRDRRQIHRFTEG